MLRLNSLTVIMLFGQNAQEIQVQLLMYNKIVKNLKQWKRHIPVMITGICCWIFLWYFTGTSCWIRSLFGIPCPGCGSTRAVIALFHGNIKEAMEFHPLIFVSLALIVAYIITLFFKINIFKVIKNKKFNIFLWCVFGLYMGVYIIRMIFLYPRIEPMTYLDTSILGRVINFIKNI
ncbi:MAG: DUF2752 domain-containing protein [Oscillospiraceae bacterium]|nr:DUF2752 domain-containing protein [Oscillospiraceae bacterium]